MGLLSGDHDDRAELYGELATLLDSGILLREALRMAARRASLAGRLAARLEARVAPEAGDGVPLAEAMAADPAAFPPFESEVAAAGERSGKLPESLRRLARHHESRGAARARLLQGLIYPAVVVHLGILVVPLYRLVSEGLGAYLVHVLPGLAIVYGLVLAVGLVRRAPAGSAVRSALDRVVLGLPFFGALVRRLVVADYAQSLALLYGAGIPVFRALEQAEKTCRNAVIAAAAGRATDRVRAGEKLGEAFAVERDVFPAIFVDLVETGETSGKLDDTLIRAADRLRTDGDRALETLAKVLPIVALLVVGAYVGYIVISFYTQYYGQLTR